MADAVVSFALEVIVSSLIRQISTSRRVQIQIESIQEKLLHLKGILKHIEANKRKDEKVRYLVRKFKILSYRMEDALETYAIRLQLRRGRGFKGAVKTMFFGYAANRTFEAETQKIEDMLADISSSAEVLNLSGSFLSQSCMIESEGHDNLLSLRETYPHGVDHYVDGKNDGFNHLSPLIFNEEKEFHAISIYGMGGMGKSALAKKMFNHEDIKNHFQAFAWVYVGQGHSIKKIYRRLLRQLLQSMESVMHIDNIFVLTEQLQQVLQEKKCLIVLDDIWSIDDWTSLGISAEGTASKILLTTRIKKVAEYVSREKCVHIMRCLSDDEGWDLFKKRALIREDVFSAADVKVHPMKEEMGKQILKQCKGLPLAIVMLGDFMATKHTLREWEIVSKNSESYLSRGQQFGGSATISQVLGLSYENLDHRMKVCFLHLGNFLEGDIEVEKLYLLWMAEGIVEPAENRSQGTMMATAENILNELALQGMIEVQEEEVPIFRRFKSCCLPGLMQEFCILKGKEEEFMNILDFRRGNQLPENSDAFSLTMTTRRLAVHLDNHEVKSVTSLMQEIAKLLQCLLIHTTCDDQQELVWPPEIFCIEKFRVLKVLIFDGLDFQKTKLPNGIVKLLSLRYLSFRRCSLCKFPSYIGSMPYLQILDLRVNTHVTMIIPDILWKIKTLRYLYFPQRFRTVNDTKLRLEGLIELETLHGLNAGLCRLTDLLELTNLRHLSAAADCSLEDLKEIFSLLNLKKNSGHEFYSFIDVRNFDCYTEERHLVFRQLLGCCNLHGFRMEGHIGQLPSRYQISESLIEMVLSGSKLKKDPMIILGKLPDLRALVLNDEACLAEEIVCLNSCFPKLNRLRLANLRCLKRWTMEKGSLPTLSKLTIESCWSLESLPEELISLCSLQQVDIVNMPSLFEEHLRHGWDGKYEFQPKNGMLSLSCKQI